MNWIATNKDLLAVLVALGSLVVSIIALIRASRRASLTTKFQRSSLLRELHDKVRPGRLAMQHIWDRWRAGADKKVEELSDTDEKQFIEFYNSE